MVGLIHPETHFTDQKAGRLREATYTHLRRHWQFINELKLFDIHHLVSSGVHIYGEAQAPRFMQATSLYHPATVEGSLKHNGLGSEPGIKDENGNWDQRPHSGRILSVDDNTLQSWSSLLGLADIPSRQTSMVYSVSASSASVLKKLTSARRIAELSPKVSHGWDENKAYQEGRFVKRWGPAESWNDVILQGPHFHVATPFYKQPNPTMKHNQDWSPIDLEGLPADAVPITSYKPSGDRAVYDAQYLDWGTAENPDPVRNHYRVAWRSMAANTGERTLIPIIIPKGTAHVDAVSSMGLSPTQDSELVICSAILGSLLSDFLIRAVPKSTIRLPSIARLPYFEHSTLSNALVLRVMRLNCITGEYGDLWREIISGLEFDGLCAWTGGIEYPGRPRLEHVSPVWDERSRLTRASDRRQALLEIDALVALGLGITADELCSLYRTQFPVLYNYDRTEYLYDANGRLVPKTIRSLWERLGGLQDPLAGSLDARGPSAANADWSYRYELPFAYRDREYDLRVACERFRERL